MAKKVSKLLDYAAAAPAAGSEALLATGADVASLYKQFVPVLTGELRDSIGAVPTSSTRVEVGALAPHAPYVEFGTSKMEAQPALVPAFVQAEPAFKARLAAAVKKRMI